MQNISNPIAPLQMDTIPNDTASPSNVIEPKQAPFIFLFLARCYSNNVHSPAVKPIIPDEVVNMTAEVAPLGRDPKILLDLVSTKPLSKPINCKTTSVPKLYTLQRKVSLISLFAASNLQ